MTEPSIESTVARLCFPRGDPGGVTTAGGTESTLLGMLLAKKDAAGAPVQTVCTRGSRPEVARVVGQLGMPAPVMLDTFDALPAVLGRITAATVVVMTVGTADTGAIDPLREVARVCRLRGTWVHVDAADGGVALFSDRLRPLLAGVELADSVAFEFPSLEAGIVVVRTAESLLTVRPPAVPDISAVFRAKRHRLAADLEDRCDLAAEVADEIAARPRLRLLARPELSTVVFRPAGADDATVAELCRGLPGFTGLGRVNVAGRTWLRLAVSDRAEHLRLLDLCSLSATALTPND
ncbi:pyridoxal-dependent decarboxylase [Actinocrispum wychmicini]|uniref:L-2,4-diaminobutyrate decarboxylase n=1 Tax=Actinocrispum wychmicini TaxID=1213861 RepID=A0A4R2J753_9PSEU|nr:pyridoxal-dependent decarboxylase [Actinocrispum wychmicini]TCO52406.1 L-2,4-diaminobutyrate decarboxylase [Actinocrispum wychmicini]